MREPPLDGSASRSQIRGSTLLLGGQALATLLNLITQVLIVRYLSKAEFGAFAYALAVASIAEIVIGLGLRRAVVRHVPMYEERGEAAKAAGTLVFVLTTLLSMGLAVVLFVVGLRGLIAGSVAAPAETVLAILVVLAPLQALSAALDALYAVYTRPVTIVLRRFVLTPGLRLGVVALMILTEAGAPLLAAGYVAVGVIGLAFYAALLPRALAQHPLGAALRERRLSLPVREILTYTTPLLTSDVSALVLNAVGAVILGLLATAADVAELRAVFPVAMTMSYLLSTFVHLFTPLAVRLHERGDHAELTHLYWRTAAWSTVVAYPLFLTATGLAEPVTELLFGERYEDAAVLLAILAAGLFVVAATGPNDHLLAAIGDVRFIAATNLLAIGVGLVLNFVLISAYDAVGAAVAASVTFAFLNLVRQVGLRQRTHVGFLDRETAPLYVRILIVTACYYAVLVTVSPPEWAAVALTVLAVLAVLLGARRHLALTDTFPELARLPGMKLLMAGRGSAD